MIALRRKLTGCLVAAFLGASISMSPAQDRAPPPMAPHAHPGSAAPPASSEAEAQFLVANEAATGKMMADMAAAPTGDIDRDFVAMMVPHHQGAIEMAQIILRYGKNEQLKRLAAGGGGEDIAVEVLLEMLPQHFAQVRFVIHDQKFHTCWFFRRRSGFAPISVVF